MTSNQPWTVAKTWSATMRRCGPGRRRRHAPGRARRRAVGLQGDGGLDARLAGLHAAPSPARAPARTASPGELVGVLTQMALAWA